MSKPDQYSKPLLLKINLHFDTSDDISTYGKLNLFPISSIYLVIFSLEMLRSLVKTEVYYTLCSLTEKKRLTNL